MTTGDRESQEVARSLIIQVLMGLIYRMLPLQGTNLKNANVKEANIAGAKFDRTIISDGTIRNAK